MKNECIYSIEDLSANAFNKKIRLFGVFFIYELADK